MPKYTKYTKEVLIEAVKNSSSIKGAIRFAGGNPSSGGVYKHVRKKIKEYNIDTSHFLGLASNRGKSPKNKKTPEEILILDENLKECFNKRMVKSKIRRKVKERPQINTLKKEVKELGYEGTGRKYGVSGNAIKKWLK